MYLSKLRLLQTTLTRCDVQLSVFYNYTSDKGREYYPNGDVGYPPSEEIEIVNIELLTGNILTILDSYKECQNIITELEEKISEYEQSLSKKD
jgi:hypothetical protein